MTQRAKVLERLAEEMRVDLDVFGDLRAETLGLLWRSMVRLEHPLDRTELEALAGVRSALRDYERRCFAAFLADHPELRGLPRWPTPR